jgi:hypothetical protein
MRWRSWVRPNAPDSKGTLPVSWAATLGHVETVKVLVEVGRHGGAHDSGRNGNEDHDAAGKARRLSEQARRDTLASTVRRQRRFASTDDDDWNKAMHLTALNDQVDVDGNWERICQPRLSRLEQVCSANNSSVCV